MKKRTILSILTSLVLLVVTSFVVYAAFTVNEPYAGDIGYHEINNATLTSPTENLNFTFNEPGDSIDYTYGLTNSDTKTYKYYYTFSINGGSIDDSALYNMIYVYENGEYVGVLYELIFNAINLCEGSFVFVSENVTDTFTFELHNQATGYVLNEEISFSVTCFLETINAQEYIFVSNDNEFKNAIDDVNRVSGKTIILENDVIIDEEVVLENSVDIDVCGNVLTTNASVTLTENTVIEIYDSRGGGSVSGDSDFIINNLTSFLNPLIPVSNCSITSYDELLLMDAIEKRILAIESIHCNENYSILGNYSIYYGILGLDVNSVNGHTVTEGEYIAQDLSSNQVLGIEVTTNNESSLFDIKLIGSLSTVFESIISSNLVHLSKFATANSIQVTTDIFLPTSIREHNATISWWSSDENVFSHDGRIISGQSNITLRATIKLYDKVYIKDYYLYVVQEDNLSKLQYLATQVELGVSTNNITIPALKLTSVVNDPTIEGADVHYLPVAGAANRDNEYYYTNWTNGKSLGILELSYYLENVYYYISNDNTTIDSTGSKLIEDKLLTESCVYLNQVTFSKVALINIRGLFDNGQIEETTITIIIELPTAALADEVFNQVQINLNKVDVLQNILDTRAEKGIYNEKGDFKLPSSIQSVDVRYEVLPGFENLYEVATKPDKKGDILVSFKDLKYLGLTDIAAGIICYIVTLDAEGNIDDIIATSGSQNNYIDLSFIIPGAITTENFTSITGNKLFDFVKYPDTKTIFYSFKFQSLQQSTATPYYIRTNDVNTSTLLVDATVEQVYELPQYILMYDIGETKELKFEYGSTDIIIDHYDLSVYKELIAWATNEGSPQLIKDNQNLTKFIDSGYQWLTSDGDELLSDSEIAAILSYCERYQGFETYWNQVINAKDNILSEKDKNEILELLAEDQIYISLLSWIRTNNNMTLIEYLRDNNEKQLYKILENYPNLDNVSELTNEYIAGYYNIPTEFMTISNDSMESISNEEERVVVYYVLANHPDEYQTFYTTWKDNISRIDDSSENVKTISPFTISNQGGSGTITPCYDPIFAAIMNWATNYSNNNPDNSGITLRTYLQNETFALNYNSIFSDDDLNTTNYWLYRKHTVSGSGAANGIFSAEWSIIKKYLNYFGIDRINLANEIIFDELDIMIENETIMNGITEENSASIQWIWYERTDGIILTSNFISAIINILNEYFVIDAIDSFNKLLNWATASNIDDISSWTKIIQNDALNRIDENRIRDNQSRISYDEYIVLVEYLCQYYLSDLYDVETGNGQIAREHFELYLKYYTGTVDMSFSNNTFTDVGYKEVLQSIEDNYGDITEILTNISKFTNATVTDMNIYIDSFDDTEDIHSGNITISDIKIGMLEDIANSNTLTSLVFDSIGNYVLTNETINNKDVVTVSYENMTGKLLHYINSNISKVIGKNDTISFTITNNGTGSISMKIDIGHINEGIFTSTITAAAGTTEAESGTSLIYNNVDRNVIVEVAAGTSIVVDLTFANVVDTSKYFDNLETISPEELLTIANKYKGTDVATEIVDKLNRLVSAYTVSLDSNGNYTYTENDLDKKLDDLDKETLESALKDILGISDNIKKYTYIPLGQIDSDELKAFEALRYYINLDSLSFRGTSTTYLFDSNIAANSVFDIVTGVTTSLKNLTMNYTGLSNIESVDKLIELEKLDLRYNYEKDSYEGLYDISSLINLNYNYPTGKTLLYLNIYGTDVEIIYSEYVLAVLYNENNTAELWYNDNGIETLYNPGNLSDEQKEAINLCMLLHEIGSISGTVLVLPDKVYADETGVDIQWNPVKLNGLASLSSNQVLVKDPNILGEIIISASIKVGSTTYVRYFYIQVGKVILK